MKYRSVSPVEQARTAHLGRSVSERVHVAAVRNRSGLVGAVLWLAGPVLGSDSKLQQIDLGDRPVVGVVAESPELVAGRLECGHSSILVVVGCRSVGR